MSSENENAHLLVLIHGMWGNPNHLAEMRRIMTETCGQPDSPLGPADERLEILMAETNSEDHTYDGIDWGGERVAEEIYEAVDRLKKDGKTVTRFSITGYSLGGLVSRYVVGILHQRKFFEVVTPVNFNTCATPHIGLPRYRTVLSSLFQYLGPKLLSRTGEQFYAVDKWSARGRPLLEVMADPDRIFYQGLALFKNKRIYANAVNDVTVPYPTAAIEAEDPFVDHATSGLKVVFDEKYDPIIMSWSKPDTAPPPENVSFSQRIFKALRFPLPPPLAFSFPYNILIYALLPFLLPVLLTLALTRLTLASHKSRARVQLLERSAPSGSERLADVLARMERELEAGLVGIADRPGSDSSSPTPAQSRSPLTSASSDSELGLPPLALTATGGQPDADAETKVLQPGTAPAPQEQLVLTDLQRSLVRTLNTLPGLEKTLCFINPVRNSHAVIISRDVRRFEFHRRGEGVLRHWADHFVM